jgi:hypothetical protein
MDIPHTKVLMTIQTYKTYRKIGRRLNTKIMKTCLEREVLLESATVLGIVEEGALTFESEAEMDVFMDFVLNEYRTENTTAIEHYQEKVGGKNEAEREILHALRASSTSLFKVVAISENEHTLLLHDLLTTQEDRELLDIRLSQTAVPGLLVFTRLVPLKEVTITSGMSFAFAGYLEKTLLREYKKLSKKMKAESDSLKRFVAFFQLNRICGFDVEYR